MTPRNGFIRRTPCRLFDSTEASLVLLPSRRRYHPLLMTTQGVLLVVGVKPTAVEEHVDSDVAFCRFLQYERKRMSIRIRIHPPRVREEKKSPNAWHASREVGACFFALDRVPLDVAFRYKAVAGEGYVREASVIYWSENVELPNLSPVPFEIGFTLEDFVPKSTLQLVLALKSSFEILQGALQDGKIRRRINIACAHIRSACVGPVAPLGLRALGTALRSGTNDFLGASDGYTPANASAREVSQTMQRLPRDFAGWLLQGASIDYVSHLSVQPGFGEQEQDVLPAIYALLSQLRAKAWEETRLNQQCKFCGGNLRPNKSSEKTSKIFMPRQPKTSAKSSLKNHLVWVADLGVLEAAVQRGDPSLELHGLWRYCVGEGADQITIQPPIKELPHHAGQSIEIKDTAPRVFLVIGPNLHQYAHIYGSLRHGVMDFMEPSSSANQPELSSLNPRFHERREAGLPLLRSWFGLCDTTDSVASSFLNAGKGRERHLKRAGEVLHIEFSDFQHNCIMNISKRITHWYFIAGAGKTKMLAAVGLIAAWQDSHNLIVMSAGTNAVASVLEDILLHALDRESVLRLETIDQGDGSFVDLGHTWLRDRLDEAMKVEKATIAAVDRMIHLLMSYLPFLARLATTGALDRFRTLILLLFAIRHDYLDAHYYSRCEELEPLVLSKLRILIVSADMLVKLSAGVSSWSSWFASVRRNLLIADELPDLSFEALSPMMVDFDMALLAGDCNQFDATKGAKNSNRSPQPLKRHSASHWCRQLSRDTPDNIDSVGSSFQYRYGQHTINYLKAVFPDLLSGLECPRNFRKTFLLPYLFSNLIKDNDWTFAENSEVLRSSAMFTCALAVIGIEMVLGYMRGNPAGACQILIMWCLLCPLTELMSFIDAFCVDVCRSVHEIFNIPQPTEGYEGAYNYSSWIHTRRLQFKAAQNAQGSDADIAMWFIARRRRNDKGLRGEQTLGPFILEMGSRAKIRQHGFFEDLREEEVAPNGKAFRGEALKLGITNFCTNETDSNGKRLLRTYKVRDFMQKSLDDTFCGLDADSATYQIRPAHTDMLFFFLGAPICRESFSGESDAASSIWCDDFLSKQRSLVNKCKCYYREMIWTRRTTSTNREQRPALNDYFHPKHREALLQCLNDCKPRGRERQLTTYKYNDPQTTHTVDFAEWERMLVPIINVHLLDLDKRGADPAFEDSKDAMHYVNIVVPFILTLVDGVSDLNELIDALGKCVETKFRATSRGAELLNEGGSFRFYTGHHKRQQYEYGGIRFVIAACRSDRPAAILEYTNAAGKKIEALHWYVAQGLLHQQPLQTVVLARVRDIALAKCIVEVLQNRLHIQRVALRSH